MTGRRVVIWRNELLPGSETFIANQAASLTRWQHDFAGLRAVDSPLRPAAPFLVERGRLSRVTFHRTGVDPRLVAWLRRPGVGLIHAHFGPDAATVARSARLARRPLIVTFHGYDATTLPGTPAGAQLVRGVLRDAALLVAVSDFIAGRLLALGAPAERLVVRPIGIPLPELPTASPPPATDRAEVLFVGRLVEKKGAADLLRACLRLSREGLEPTVRLIGDGPLRAELERLAAPLGANVTFEGAQPPSRVRDAMSQATVLCVPSRTAEDGDAEGFGMVFLEAAALGVPAVSYASGGVPEAVADGHSGLLAPEGDHEALAAALSRVLSDRKLRDRLGRQAADRARAEFDIRALTRRLEDDYDRVCGAA